MYICFIFILHDEINSYFMKLEFHYWDMSIWNLLQLRDLLHVSKDIMQSVEKIIMLMKT